VQELALRTFLSPISSWINPACMNPANTPDYSHHTFGCAYFFTRLVIVGARQAAQDLQERLKKIEAQKKAQAERREMERLKKLIAEQAELLSKQPQHAGGAQHQDGTQHQTEEEQQEMRPSFAATYDQSPQPPSSSDAHHEEASGHLHPAAELPYSALDPLPPSSDAAAGVSCANETYRDRRNLRPGLQGVAGSGDGDSLIVESSAGKVVIAQAGGVSSQASIQGTISVEEPGASEGAPQATSGGLPPTSSAQGSAGGAPQEARSAGKRREREAVDPQTPSSMLQRIETLDAKGRLDSGGEKGEGGICHDDEDVDNKSKKKHKEN